jgi:hypothetical protein
MRISCAYAYKPGMCALRTEVTRQFGADTLDVHVYGMTSCPHPPFRFLRSGDVGGRMHITAPQVRMMSVTCWTGNEASRTGEGETVACSPQRSASSAAPLMCALKGASVQAIGRETAFGVKGCV